MASDDETKKRKLLAAAKGNLLQIYSQFPSLGGERFKAEFEAEMKQVMEEMHKAIEESGLPPLPMPGELPTSGELPPLPAPGELPPLPAPGELPPLPMPGELPPLPSPGDLPPLPDLPAPEIPVTCTSCESTFNARANKARRVKCPLCGETVKM